MQAGVTQGAASWGAATQGAVTQGRGRHAGQARGGCEARGKASDARTWNVSRPKMATRIAEPSHGSVNSSESQNHTEAQYAAVDIPLMSCSALARFSFSFTTLKTCRGPRSAPVRTNFTHPRTQAGARRVPALATESARARTSHPTHTTHNTQHTTHNTQHRASYSTRAA
jgi:hypothetical protein